MTEEDIAAKGEKEDYSLSYAANDEARGLNTFLLCAVL